MPIINGILKSPIDIKEAAEYIGTKDNDTGRLCVSDKINPKSKYKPVENPNEYEPLTDAQYADVDWGYRIPVNPITLTKFVDYIRNGVLPEGWEEPLDAVNGAVDLGMGWYYIRPMSRFRLQDLNNYNRNAQTMFSNITAPEKVYSDTSSMQIDLARGTFWVSDFNRFADSHLAVVIAKVDSGAVWFKSVTDEEGGFAKVIFSQDELRQMFTEVGNYICYAVMTTDNVQNILPSGEGYNSNMSLYPLPISAVEIEYTGITSGTSDNVVNFHINSLYIDERELSFELVAYNTASTDKVAQWVRYRLDVVDSEGNTWSSTSGNPALLQSTPFGVDVPAYSEVSLGEVTIPYSAYRYLSAPWSVTISLYHGQQEGFDIGDYMGAGVAQGDYVVARKI